MPKTQPSKKRRILLTILLTLLAATIATIAWILWAQNNDVRQSTQNENTSTNQPDPIGENTNNPAQPIEDSSEGGKYLVIEEWRVRIALPEHLRGDVSYFMDYRAANDFGGPVQVGFLSQRFSEGSLKCGEIEDGVPRKLVSMYYDELGPNSDPNNYYPALFKIIDNRGYRISEATGCEEAINRSGSEQDKQLVQDIKQAVRETLEEVR